jgi:hypothetical protein
MSPTERQIELDLLEKLRGLKYVYREDIRDRATATTASTSFYSSMASPLSRSS